MSDAEEDDRSWLGKSIDRIDAMDEAAFERATIETERLQRELDITNADHIALWLEANLPQISGEDFSIPWLACRIIEAHEAAIPLTTQEQARAPNQDQQL